MPVCTVHPARSSFHRLSGLSDAALILSVILPFIFLPSMNANPNPASTPAPETTATLVVGAGCFWCVEGVFENVDGVLDVESGFAGDHVENPTYEQVCSGKTGHAEVVKITFDPGKVSLAGLLAIFWSIHDPTDSRGVWPDFGPMYRSILLAASPEQMKELAALREEEQARRDKPLATELSMLGAFYPAGQYHQDFVRKNPDHPYVRTIARPKMEKAKAK